MSRDAQEPRTPEASDLRAEASDPRVEGLARLLGIVDRLRAPDGCPWDREQTLESLAPHVLEEAYEVVDAIASARDPERIAEIGDLLMNVFLLARTAQDGGRFGLAEVCASVSDKLLRRHPHVFGDLRATDGAGALAHWEAVKRAERRDAADPEKRSALSGVPAALPALLRAYRMGQKAAATGFDWPDIEGPLAKLLEEFEELQTELRREPRQEQRVEAELGDLLFAACNLARHLGVEPETALRRASGRFARRFALLEDRLGERLGQAELAEMDQVWSEVKDAEA